MPSALTVPPPTTISDLFREMDFAAKAHKINPCDPVAVPARRLLELGTWRGADALGLGAGHGTLTPGAPADLILIDLQQPHLQPFHSPNLLVYSRIAADVHTVIVNGQLVVANRKILTVDLWETCEQVRKIAGN